jgi:acetyl esterase/lipase
MTEITLPFVKSDALVDSELALGLSAMPVLSHLSAETVSGIRAQMLEFARQRFDAVSMDGIRVEEVLIPGPPDAPAVRALVYRPLSVTAKMPVLLHFHGGGLVFGSPEGRHSVTAELTRALGCLACSVDYRLAPDTRYPGAVEDGYCALRWLNDNAQLLNIDPRRITVIGESAGGGLAAALAILARDRGEYSISSQVLTYPMLDDRPSSTHGYPTIGQYVWTRQNNEFGWRSYLGSIFDSDTVPPTAAPARCRDFSGLPPAYIACGDLDLFVVEGMAYSQALIRSGVTTELRIYPGAFHGFDLIAGAGVSKRFQADLRDAIARALARQRR